MHGVSIDQILEEAAAAIEAELDKRIHRVRLAAAETATTLDALTRYGEDLVEFVRGERERDAARRECRWLIERCEGGQRDLIRLAEAMAAHDVTDPLRVARVDIRDATGQWP